MTDLNERRGADQQKEVLERLARLAERSEQKEVLQTGGGGGNSGGMDAWQQTVETRLGELRGDIREVRNETRALLYWMIGGFVTVISGMTLIYFKLADATQKIAEAVAALPHH